MLQPKTEREYLSYLRTFCGDFIELGASNDRGKLIASTPTNVLETANAYQIQIALPGFRKNQIHLKVEDDILLISAEVRSEKTHVQKKYHKQEIFSSSFEKSILLPEDVNDNDIKASFKDGLLNIQLPKSNHPTKSSLEISIH